MFHKLLENKEQNQPLLRTRNWGSAEFKNLDKVTWYLNGKAEIQIQAKSIFIMLPNTGMSTSQAFH